MAIHGIQVYEILENGNLLNGIYTNTGLLDTNQIDNEIARKRQYDNNGVKGHYDCTYTESWDSSVTHCELVISKNNGIYLFTWNELNEPNKILWTGIGLMSGTSHISVSYIKP